MLRYDCPFQSAVRVARERTSIGGQSIGEGQRVLILLGAANTDPSRFAQPDAFQINRADNRHLAFGSGIHSCLGLPLANAMARAAIGALVEHLPRMRLVARRPDWQFEVAGFRALRTLRVTFV